jgi:hypothetical protein
MAQFYSNPARESEPYALPDCEVFYAEAGEWREEETNERNVAGFYFWYCFPGCMPEGEPWGPYETEAEAIKACRDEVES